MKIIKSLFKSRLFVGILCLALATVVACVVRPMSLNRSPKKARVLRAANDISRGQLITKSDLCYSDVGVLGLPRECMFDYRLVEGKYASIDIRQDDYIFLSKLSDNGTDADSTFTRLNGEKYAMSVTIDSFAAGLSGKLENGDIVRLVIYKDKVAVMPEELAYVKVIAATTKSGIDKDKIQEDSGSDKIPSTVTFLVNDIQASLLADYENSSKIHICLVFRGDAEYADEFLKEQDDFFLEAYKAGS